ncbi:seven in absentia [Carabus blaptoides fortunei]
MNAMNRNPNLAGTNGSLVVSATLCPFYELYIIDEIAVLTGKVFMQVLSFAQLAMNLNILVFDINKMVDISEEVLTTLRCTECSNYLSCTPVMVNENGDSICGRCPILQISNRSLVRNKAYENLAKIVQFPCRFHNEGCLKKLPMEDIMEHEEDCEYIKWICPALPVGSCNWTGPRTEIYQHFKAKHVDLIYRTIDQPSNFKYDSNKVVDKNILTVMLGFIFLVQIRTNPSHIWQCVRLIGSAKFASQFKYLLTITKNEYKLMVQKIVNQQTTYNANGEHFIELSVDTLKYLFGNLEDMMFSLIITRSVINCMKCNDTIKQSTKYDCLEEAKYCDNCHSDETHNEIELEKGIYCSYRNEGCKFVGNEIDLKKHSYWFCNYETNNCQFCNKYLKPETRVDHFKKCEKLITQYSNTAVTEIACTEINFLQVEIHEEIFYCIFNVKGKYLWIYVVSQSASEKLDKFEIELTMELDKIKYKKEKLTKFVDTDNKYDWRGKFNVNNNGPYNIEFHIKKNK